MENNKKYAYALIEKGWRNGFGWNYREVFESDELADNAFAEKVKNGALSLSDWDDFLKFSGMGADELEARTDSEESDTQWEMAIFNIDDFRAGNLLSPVYKCFAWESELAKEWLAS